MFKMMYFLRGGGAVTKWSKAVYLRTEINKYQKFHGRLPQPPPSRPELSSTVLYLLSPITFIIIVRNFTPLSHFDLN